MKISRVLISVSDKTGIVEFAKGLAKMGVEIISTGGTAKALREAGVQVRDISNLTGYPEIMDGRVKTLHPSVHGGLLAARDNRHHLNQMNEHGISNIDMVVVNLYPFEKTVAGGGSFEEIIENIDIGGPAMIRSAAKNFRFVTVVANHERYDEILGEMQKNDGATTLETRQILAAEAYSKTASYDSAISGWFNTRLENIYPQNMAMKGSLKTRLRYGENPHQSAALYIDDAKESCVANAKIIQGKELSYNNILDADSAYELVCEYSQNAAVIVKHNNPCGVAVDKNQKDAYSKALACDPVSAFGGIFAFNRQLDEDAASEIAKLFAEVVVAPSFSSGALNILSAKKNLRLLEIGSIIRDFREKPQLRSINGGFLLQGKNTSILNGADMKIVTNRKPTPEEMSDLLFAFTVCKHVKSNAIVYAKNGATIGIGAGQMSRVDSSRIGAWKAEESKNSLTNSVMASDAFFPFADGLEAAVKYGCNAVIQPGGSIRDNEVIEAANKAGIAMIFTGMRHFKH